MASFPFLSIFYLFMVLLVPPPFSDSATLPSVKLKLVHVDSTPHATKYQTLAQRDKQWTSTAAARLLKIHHDLLVLDTPTATATHEETYEYNSLILGGNALLEGSSTPILNSTGKVFVNLERIMLELDDEVVDIDPSLFQRHDSNGDTMMDSGSAVTFLTDDAYEIFFDKLMEKMTPATNVMCFSSLDTSRVPTIQFIFEEGANLTLGIDAFFDPATPSGLRCFNGIKDHESFYQEST